MFSILFFIEQINSGNFLLVNNLCIDLSDTNILMAEHFTRDVQITAKSKKSGSISMAADMEAHSHLCCLLPHQQYAELSLLRQGAEPLCYALMCFCLYQVGDRV